MATDRNDRGQKAAVAVIKIVGGLARELHPEMMNQRGVSLDSSLDRDLGFDSLARVELLSRLEKTFSVTLSERAFSDAETPRDLLRALAGAHSTVLSGAPETLQLAEGVEAADAPHASQTLLDVLDWHLERDPERIHVYLQSEEGEGEPLSFRQLYEGARSVAAGLQQRGLHPGEPVALMLPTGADYLSCFYGTLLVGGVPVPIYPPFRAALMADHLERQRSILGNCGARILVTMPEASAFARLLLAQIPSLHFVLTVEQMQADSAAYVRPSVSAHDPAFIQYTSGSTGDPKGVVLTHANLLANIRAMGEAVKVHSRDIIVSWLPLYHDMGLIGCWLSSLYHAAPLVLLSPLNFLTRPRSWLWAIHRYRATLSPAPNFAYEICLSKLTDQDLQGLDLSSWRGAFNGAEQVSPVTLERFCKKFAPFGFRCEAMMPVYGMAECSVGLAFPPLGRGPLIDRVRREEFSTSGRALPAGGDEASLRFVACGRPLREHEIRIVDDHGRELPERREGRVQFRGPSACSGYFRNPEETARLFAGEWLETGDLGYIAGGDIYITGRIKDVIIVAGRNVYPQELEEAVGGVRGIRKGNVAIFGTSDDRTGTERLVVVAETRETQDTVLRKLRDEINALSVDVIGMPPAEVVLAPPRAIPKTSSGKIRRSFCRKLYERGELGRKAGLWSLVRGMAAVTVRSQWQRFVRNVSALGYASYAWGLFYLVGLPSWGVAMLLPHLHWRWAFLRRSLRFLAWASRTSLSVQGLGNLPVDQPCILVANHASYLDGYALVAVLPVPFRFVAKIELLEKWAVRLVLERLGTEFVERFDRKQGVEGAKRLGVRAKAGHSLVFFPEGTFTRVPGLRPFRMGAFVVAAEANLPMVPIVIRGTRSMLRSGSWFPHRGAISIRIGAPVYASEGEGESDSWSRALRLRDNCRDYIRLYCGEPDVEG